ncbi:MAG: transposase [Verrucomicrobiota bacterium]
MGWHSRGYLPHLDAAKEIQAVTFRLADALSAMVIERWQRELENVGQETDENQRAKRLHGWIARYEDAGHGACVLQQSQCAEIVQSALLHFDGDRYRMLEWVIMPNHVHMMLETLPGYELAGVIKSWKSFTARRIHDAIGGSGPLWQREYFDRYIRDENHFHASRKYIHENPVKAGLVAQAEDWRWGSASQQRSAGFAGSASNDTKKPV